MSNVLLLAQMILALMLIGAILLQSQGSGLSATWSGGGESYHTRRGLEKVLFAFTIAGTAVFAVLSLVNVLTK